jgi:Tol biopolymer transport system component
MKGGKKLLKLKGIVFMMFLLSIFVATNVSAANQIAFTSGRDGNWEIYVMNADGSSQTNLTNNPALDSGAAWSPDGSRIAFYSDRDGNYEIYVMNADGSGQTRLTNNPAVDNIPAWSPDGSKIAFYSGRDGNWEIYVMNADGSGQTNLTNNPAGDYWAAWSPDGSKIAFTSLRDGNWEIYVMNADGTGQINLTNNPASDDTPAWSSDGSKIAFTSYRDGNGEIYVMNADGTGQTNLTNNPALDLRPDWSLDGSKIAFDSDRDGNEEIYVMNADGTGQINLTNNPAFDFSPDWGPEVPTMYWKDYNGQDAGGYMPDIDQNQDFDKVIVRTEETGAGVSFLGNWTVYNDQQNASGGTLKYSNDLQTPASCSFTFNGTSISWIGFKQYNMGISEVWIDGQLDTTVDLYTVGSLWKQVLYTNNNLTHGQHTITIKPTNQQNPLSQGFYTNVDAFDVDNKEKEYCAPVAEANSLWWLDKRYEEIEIFTDPINGKGYIGGDINGDGVVDILDLVQDLANLMKTNQGHTGTLVADEQTGIDAFLEKYNLTGRLDEHTVTDNTLPEPYTDLFAYIEAEVERSQDVKLDLGFWHVDEVYFEPSQGIWKIVWSRRGGHAVTVAGVDSENMLFAISDPDNDAAEKGGAPGVVRPVPNGHPAHPNDTSVHNNEMFASHDIYRVGPSPSPGGEYGLLNYPFKWNFPENEWETVVQDWGPEPPPVDYCMTFTEIEAAVIVSPIPPNKVADPERWNFGKVVPGSQSDPKTFTISNTGGLNLTINSISLAGTNPTQFKINQNNCGASLSSGQSCTVIVKFKPTSRGKKTAVLRIKTNDPDTPQNDVSLTGNGVKVKLTSPNGGEALTSGNSHTITWQIDPSLISKVGRIILKYTANGGATWKKITAINHVSSFYYWIVPEVDSDQCKVNVILKKRSGKKIGADTSDAVFTITP